MDASQLILDFPVDPVCTFATLTVGPFNRLVVLAVQALPERRGQSLTLIGEEGVGKSHLLRAAVQQRGEGHGIYLDLGNPALLAPGNLEVALADFLGRHAPFGLVAVDGLERLTGWENGQEAILYLYNRLREEGGNLLAASRLIPDGIVGLRSDLRSRLLWGPVMTLEMPGEAELATILVKLAGDRQMRLSADVVHFLMVRLPRRVSAYLDAVERLDRLTLAKQRPLTVPLAKKALDL